MALTRKKKFWLTVVAVVVLCLVGAGGVLVQRLMNLETYRGTIIASVQESLKRDLQDALMRSGDPAAAPGLSEMEKKRVEMMKQTASDGRGYLQIQTTRPQTLAYALTDSPAGQLAWIVEKFKEWTDSAAELPEQAVNRDQLLTNVSLYWFTRSGASAAHTLYESMHAQEWGEPGPAPIGWAVFGSDPIARRLIDPEHKIEHWSEFKPGGHFPAMEAPLLLAGDLQKFFRPLRTHDNQ
jgi:hypothetical protein